MNRFIHDSLKDFLPQIKLLMDNYHVVSINDIQRYIENNITLPKNSVAIIIDDGFKNFYNIIYPVIKSFDIPVAVAISWDRIDDKIIPWDIALSILSSFNNNYNKFNILSKKFLNMTPFQRIKFISFLKNKLKSMSIDPFSIDPQLRAMNMEQLIEISNDKNITLLSHGLSHNPLDGLDGKIVEYELMTSKNMIEELTNKKCEVFVYPQGKYDSNLVKSVENVGYKYAFTVDHGFIKRCNNRYLLKRINVPPFSSFEEFICRVTGAGILLSKIVRIFKILY